MGAQTNCLNEIDNLSTQNKLMDKKIFTILCSKYSILDSIVAANYSELKLRVHNENLIFLFSTKTYVVGTQKNRLNETVLLSTQNIC